MPANNNEAIDTRFGPPISTAVGIPGRLEMADINEGLSGRNRVKEVLSGGVQKAIKTMSACGDWALMRFLQMEKLSQDSNKK